MLALEGGSIEKGVVSNPSVSRKIIWRWVSLRDWEISWKRGIRFQISIDKLGVITLEINCMGNESVVFISAF